MSKKDLTEGELLAICGGMRWQDYRLSDNFEDRRGQSPGGWSRSSPNSGDIPTIDPDPGGGGGRGGGRGGDDIPTIDPDPRGDFDGGGASFDPDFGDPGGRDDVPLAPSSGGGDMQFQPGDLDFNPDGSFRGRGAGPSGNDSGGGGGGGDVPTIDPDPVGGGGGGGGGDIPTIDPDVSQMGDF
jgi:hypothetical protein